MLKRILVAVVVLFCVCTYEVEARIYSNTKYGYEIFIPDYFVIRDNLGLFDLRADGGDDYGEEKWIKNSDGIYVLITSRSADCDSWDREHMIQKVQGYRKAAEKSGIKPSNFFWVTVEPEHSAIGTNRTEVVGENIRIVMNIEGVFHGRNMNVTVAGTKNNADEMSRIIKSFKCLKH